MAHPERIMPDVTEPGIVAIHQKRYDFALAYCSGADVLDAACGVGYGTASLALVASSALGVDVDEASIEYARSRYGPSGAAFGRMDVNALSLADRSFDVVCSFETIEHLDLPERAIAEFARVLRPEGILLVSTPHVVETTREPANPFHRIELSRPDFEALLRRHFGEIEIFGQRRLQTQAHRIAQRLDVLGLRRRVALLRRSSALLGTAATESLTVDDLVISADDIAHATELVAVCRAR